MSLEIKRTAKQAKQWKSKIVLPSLEPLGGLMEPPEILLRETFKRVVSLINGLLDVLIFTHGWFI